MYLISYRSYRYRLKLRRKVPRLHQPQNLQRHRQFQAPQPRRLRPQPPVEMDLRMQSLTVASVLRFVPPLETRVPRELCSMAEAPFRMGPNQISLIHWTDAKMETLALITMTNLSIK